MKKLTVCSQKKASSSNVSWPKSPGLPNEAGLACDFFCILLLSSSYYLWTVGQTLNLATTWREARAARVQFSGNIGPVSDDVQPDDDKDPGLPRMATRLRNVEATVHKSLWDMKFTPNSMASILNMNT